MADPIRVGSGSIILVPDARQFRRQAETELRRVELIHRVQLMPQIRVQEYRREAQSQLDRVVLRHRVALYPELQAGFRTDARGKVDAALRSMDRTVRINLELSTTLANAQMTAWRREQEARPLRIRVVTERTPAGAGGAREARSAVERLPAGFSQRGSGLLIPVSIDDRSLGEATRKLDNFARENFGSGGRPPSGRFRDRFRITPSIPDLKNDPAIRNAMRKQSYEFNDAFRLRIQPNLAGLQLRLPLGGLGIAAIPEMISQVGGLTAAFTQLSQTILAVPGAVAGAGAAIATVAVGMVGFKEAWKALSTEEKNSSQTALQTKEAQRGVIDAVNEEQRARRSLSDALQNEQRRQRDLKLELRGSKLTEAEAILAVQDAEAAIREGHFANTREYDHAILTYEESKQRLLEVRNKNADLAQDVAKNEKTGVLGSDAVLNATQALTAATERVADAQAKLAAGGTALDQASAKARDALAKLSPSGREFIQTLFDMRPALRQFANDIQEPLTRGLGPAVQRFFNSPNIQTNLRTGMAGLAAQMNGIVQQTMGRLGDPKLGTGDIITRIFGNTTDAAERFKSGVVNPLITGLSTLTAAGTDALPRVTSAMGDLANRFSAFITKADADGSLKHWIDQGLDAFTQLGRIMGNLMSSFEGISRAFGGTFLTNIDNLTARFARFLNSAQGQQDLTNFISETRISMEAWKPILKELPDLLREAFDAGRVAVATFLPIIQLAVDVIRSCPGLITGVVTAFVAWKTISPIVTGMQGVMNVFAQTVTNVSTKFGPMREEGRQAAAQIDKAFENTSAEGGALHRTARGVSGLAGMLQLGGPLAAAITTGAMFVLDQWIAKQEEAAQVTENLRHQQEQLADTLDRTTGLVTQQTRESVAKSFTDFKPQDKGGLQGNVLAAAAALGIGGAGGADLVTAALPAGGGQYQDIMKGLRDRVRPQVLDFIKNQGIDMGRAHITEDDLVDAFLGVPAALEKIRNVKQFGVQAIDLGTLADQVTRGGGQGLQAALVGQALNEQRFGVQGAGTLAGQAAQAARLPVGLNPSTAGVFGGRAAASANNGEFKIVSDIDPSSSAMQSLLKDPNSGITATENPPGTTPYKSWTYSLTRAQAQKYMTGVPAYDSGGPSKAGPAILHDREFVLSDKAEKYPDSFKQALNQGLIDPDAIPHYDDGGPYPPKELGPPLPTPTDTSGINTGPDLHGAAEGPLPQVTDDSFTPGGKIANAFGGGDFAGGAGGFDPMNILKTFLGGGGSGGGPTDFGALAARFGGILMQGVLGFFGINPQYINDFDKVLNFGLGKLGGGGIDPSAQASIQSKIVGYENDGSPIYALPSGSGGTPLPGVTGGSGADATGGGGGGGAVNINAAPGSGGGSSPGTTPGGFNVGVNPASRANFGGASPPTVTPSLLKSAGIAPLYSWNDTARKNPSSVVPGWVNSLAKQFGLTASTYPEGGTLHEAGFAFDFNDPDSPGGDSAKLDTFADFIQQHLAGQTLQLIHASPGGKRWGIAAGSTVGPGTSAPNYFSADWGGHFDHVHWATDVPIAAGPGGAAAAWSIAGAKPGGGTGSWSPDQPGTPGGSSALAALGSYFSSRAGGAGGASPSFPAPLDGAGGGAGGLPGRPGGAGQGFILWSPKHGVIGTVGGGTDLFGAGGGGASSPFGGAAGSGSVTTANPNNLSGIKQMAYQLYLASGMPPTEWSDFDQLEQHEAGWSATAQNPSSTAYGLGQFLDSTWAAVGGQKTSDPKMQLQYMYQYLKQRYHGSPAEAWRMWQSRSPHWYASGGPLYPGLNLAMVEPGNGPEIVVNAQQQQRIAQAIAASATPADPNRSGTQVPPEIINQIPRQFEKIGPQPQPTAPPTGGPLPPEQAPPPPGPAAPAAPEEPQAQAPFAPPPPSTPSQPSPMPSGAPGAAASTVPGVGPGERPEQANIAPAPTSTDHELPALKQGVTSGFATAGSIAAAAASMGLGGMGGGAAGSLISGLFSEGGKIANAALNVIASAGVGTLTPGTTENPYGVTIKGQQAPQTLAPIDNGTHYHGDLYSTDMNEFFRQQELRDAQHMQSQLGSKGY